MPAHSRSKNGVAPLACVAGIHVFPTPKTKTWMAGTSPAMTGAIISEIVMVNTIAAIRDSAGR
jgi:hypothetical protein